ncbi:YlaI family protein [Piscibacillus sp. B03]|uniref:YlaI family protein n=1 Tax=Piscibacillus sp. B03 TaxID=3457430 RepID=UPI003FCC6E1B
MRVKCVLCEQIERVEPFSLLAKNLRKRRVQTYICQECHDRIGKKTLERRKNENFKLYEEPEGDPHI